MDDTTADTGSIDAVAASLIDGPPQEDEQPEDLEQSDEDDAQDQTEDDDAEPEEASAEDEDEGADESDADVEEEEPAEQLFTVKVDGRDQQVPLTELLRGYAGQAYIQKGMKEVATIKQQVAAVYEALNNERQQIAQFAQAAQTGQVPMRPPEPPSEELLARRKSRHTSKASTPCRRCRPAKLKRKNKPAGLCLRKSIRSWLR